MTEWYQQAYKGGPMVKVDGFPRPLYPPDAKGYTPSPNGPDVEAYKRTVSRAGRWPWQSFDEAFSNAFSHGKPGGNVADSGVAGVQRQQKLQPSGYIGEATFNTLRSIRVPNGPHAGEMAMDAYAVSLINKAWKLYAGKAPEPPPPPTPDPPPQSGRSQLAAHFNKRNGYTEQPANSNCDNRSDGIRTAQDKTAGGSTWLRYQPWCGCWCFYALQSVGVKNLGSWMASVASIESYAKQRLYCFTGWTADRSKVRTGDLVVIGGSGVHVGTVRGFSGSSTLTWEGNTSSGVSGSQSNGGGAFERTRSPSEVYGYALVRYPGE